ncbi:MAG TPA: J domain-containing protein [Dokdonella sp.]|uniref:J domain-containing protein n=1 Tax=Dokdonella sp. TaxID=2291710 RepID=UPI0025C61680|nr:J domain-containing protein [Dokdonella sp.]MBX3691095.1 J domain-containing protein [Dokdonella sp.]MCW5567129.1 J domain-containing protein [Dokdonella sp.]HNR92310.1 J domain-containing protein [Dokdonella sp.]
MTRGIDFLRLYHEFGLAPDAGIDDLKRAYRRFVSTLHPDRHGDDPISQHLAQDQLARLTRLYDAAIRFHREHGRLPGAAPSARSGDNSAWAAAQRIETADAVPRTPQQPDLIEPGPRSGLRPGLWLAGVGVVGLFVWLIARLAALEDALVPEPVRTAPAASVVAAPPTPRAGGIHVGMRAEDVLRIQGEPVTRSEYRWEYGPSWIQFENGRVTTWYSSPLRALRIARTPPSPEATRGD